MSDEQGVASLVEANGVAWVAARYVERLRRRLETACDESRERADAEPGNDWIDDALLWGGDWDNRLRPETRLALVIAAVEAAADDDGALWCIGDMPADHLVGDSPAMIPRLHLARASSRGVDRMFVVMHDYLHRHGHDLSWWGDASPSRP